MIAAPHSEEYEFSYDKTVTSEFYWHQHYRPTINVDTPPHVHAHKDGDDVDHAHLGLGQVCAIGRPTRSEGVQS